MLNISADAGKLNSVCVFRGKYAANAQHVYSDSANTQPCQHDVSSWEDSDGGESTQLQAFVMSPAMWSPGLGLTFATLSRQMPIGHAAAGWEHAVWQRKGINEITVG